MTIGGTRPIVVGVDGSPESIAAARWAAAEARLHQRALLVVCVYAWPAPLMPLSGLPADITDESLRHDAEAVVAGIIEAVPSARTDVALTGSVVAGLPAHKLIELSDHASMIVVGHRGHGGFAALRLGSVAANVAAHANCPVAVVRSADAATPATGTVLVGVDGSPSSDAALVFAFVEAARRATSLTVLHAWDLPPTPWPNRMWPPGADVTAFEAAEERRLEGWVQPWQEKYPEVTVRQVMTSQRPATALLDGARDAAVVVVGGRGHGGFAGLLLGSVSQQMIHHAPCPTVVVR